jgi:hypothetical protein
VNKERKRRMQIAVLVCVFSGIALAIGVFYLLGENARLAIKGVLPALIDMMCSDIMSIYPKHDLASALAMPIDGADLIQCQILNQDFRIDEGPGHTFYQVCDKSDTLFVIKSGLPDPDLVIGKFAWLLLKRVSGGKFFEKTVYLELNGSA